MVTAEEDSAKRVENIERVLSGETVMTLSTFKLQQSAYSGLHACRECSKVGEQATSMVK